MNPSGPILVIGEVFDGRPRAASLEAVTAALAIAEGRPVVVALPGDAPEHVMQTFAQATGVDRVLVIEGASLAPFVAVIWAAAFGDVAGRLDAATVIVPGSITGRDYAARIAARFDAGMASDCTALSVDDGKIIARRAVLGGRVETAVTFDMDMPVVVTTSPGAFPRPAEADVAAPIERIPVDAGTEARVEVIERFGHRKTGRSLASAERIVSGGRGLGAPEHFSMAERLAVLLDAAVGASGAAVGAGWRSHDDQVGSTGTTVSPKVYVAIGISGAPQHLVGMQGAEIVVVINRDPDAPIFGIADFGIVGDLHEVVPAIIARLETRAASSQ